jgi:hypothetical protein
MEVGEFFTLSRNVEIGHVPMATSLISIVVYPQIEITLAIHPEADI